MTKEEVHALLSDLLTPEAVFPTAQRISDMLEHSKVNVAVGIIALQVVIEETQKEIGYEIILCDTTGPDGRRDVVIQPLEPSNSR